MNLSQACRTWREVAFSQRSLWGKAVISPRKGENREREFRRTIKACKYWYRKSHGIMQSVELGWNDGNSLSSYSALKIHNLLNNLLSEVTMKDNSKSLQNHSPGHTVALCMGATVTHNARGGCVAISLACHA